MSDAFRGVLRGVRPVDWFLAVALSLLGVLMMFEDVMATDAEVAREVANHTMVHAQSTHTWWVLPAWLLATVPVLWWRRNVVLVTGTALAVMTFHDVVFGWLGRCGSGLPLAFVLTFLGAVAYERGTAWLTFALGCLLSVAVLAVDAVAGPGTLVLTVPVSLILFGVGRAVRHRTALSTELRARNEELRALRDEGAALGVADDRARLSQQLDGLIQARLDQLAYAAGSAEGLDAAASRALLERIEADSRTTLDDMREIVGLLRGGDVALAPAPTVAHLDALLARHTKADARLTVTGDPRSLPATVELSAYRIVEHLVNALADQPDSRIEVDVRFDEAVIEIRVRGPVRKGADVRAAAARAKERATLLGGSVGLKVSRGHAKAIALLPVLR